MQAEWRPHMRIELHPSTNLQLAPDPPPVECEARELVSSVLPVTQTEIAGLPALVTFWRPTTEEIVQLAEGGVVQLWVYGDRHPPVALGVEPAPYAYGRAH